LRLYEYEAKSILSQYEVPTPKGAVVASPQQAREATATLNLPVAVKAQVLLGGRGKASGILFADTAKEAEKAAEQLLNMQIRGTAVRKVLVEEKIRIRKELYFGITVDRLSRCYIAAASAAGGIDIEEVAAQSPEQIHKAKIKPQLGLRPFHARQLAKKMGYNGSQMVELAGIFEKLYRLGMDFDAEIVEVNPLAETPDGKFVAVDARLIIDDNALFRHPNLAKKRLEEPRDLSPREAEALRKGIDYVKLEGDIGVVGNGAGLVMATLDVLSFCGGKPANFLDLGGGASAERIATAIETVLSDPEVGVSFINILGGMTRCDEVARAVVEAKAKTGASKPVVVRLVGTNEEEGKRILREAGMSVFDSMEEAAERAVALSHKGAVE